MIDLDKVHARNLLPHTIPPGATAAELGVAEGLFSEQLLESGGLSILYSIDRWAGDRGHDEVQYRRAVARLEPFGGRSEIMRMDFDQAALLFPDHALYLVYIDGYAHEGPASTIKDWWPKVKRGGILAGHDYGQQWPLVTGQVDAFVEQHGLALHVIPAESGKYTFPSWAVRKP